MRQPFVVHRQAVDIDVTGCRKAGLCAAGNSCQVVDVAWGGVVVLAPHFDCITPDSIDGCAGGSQVPGPAIYVLAVLSVLTAHRYEVRPDRSQLVSEGFVEGIHGRKIEGARLLPGEPRLVNLGSCPFLGVRARLVRGAGLLVARKRIFEHGERVLIGSLDDDVHAVQLASPSHADRQVGAVDAGVGDREGDVDRCPLGAVASEGVAELSMFPEVTRCQANLALRAVRSPHRGRAVGVNVVLMVHRCPFRTQSPPLVMS